MSADSDSQLTLIDLIHSGINGNVACLIFNLKFMIDLPESKSLYDTPRSTRPSSVVDQGHYDSPR